MKHTPTPWNYDITAGNSFSIYCEGTIKTIASVLFKDVNYMPNEKEAEANAKFIVKAVNSHDKLIEALKSLVGMEVWIDDIEMKKHFIEKVYNTLKSCE